MGGGAGGLGRRAREVLARLDGLPTLSSVAVRVVALAGSRDADVQQIAELIEADPALAARILALCAKAERGVGRRVASVRQAASLLGLDAVRAAVLSVAVYEALEAGSGSEERGSAESGFDRPGFWTHSLAVGCAAEQLARHARSVAAPGEAFVCGLLHDAGRAMLDLALPGGYGRVLELARQRGEDSAGVEREVLGIDHHQAAERVFAQWGLAAPVREAAARHAAPPADAAMTTRVVGVARALARGLHLGQSHDYGPLPDPDALASLLRVGPDSIGAARRELPELVRQRSEALGLNAPTGEGMLLEAIGRANRELGDLASRLARQEARARRAADLASRRAAELERALARAAAAERRAARAEAMARLGEITAGAAHELHNPLAVIHGRAQLLTARLGGGEAKAAAEVIVEASRRVSGLVRALHELAQPREPALEVMRDSELRDWLAAACDGFVGDRGSGGPALVRVEPGLGSVRVDRELLRDAVVEAARNAVEWGGGALVRAYADPAPGRWTVEISDSGPGFTERALRHGCDAFFSERGAGRRVGLGLTRARAMIEWMGGQIELSNRPGGGAVVSVRLAGRQAAGAAGRDAA